MIYQVKLFVSGGRCLNCGSSSSGRPRPPALRRWTDRVRRIPGFMVMSGISPAGRALEQA